MFMLECRGGCGTTTVVDCTCPQALLDAGEHRASCGMSHPGTSLVCATNDGCCTKGGDCPGHMDHHSDCEPGKAGSHGPCPDAEAERECGLWAPVKAHHHAMVDSLKDEAKAKAVLGFHRSEIPDACPGGHCHADDPDCAVHRPIMITALAPGMAGNTTPAAKLQAVVQGGEG
jgi:hypothetical protein